MATKHAEYFLPEPLRRFTSASLLRGIAQKKAVVEHDGFKVRGVLLSGARPLLRKFAQRTNLARGLIGRLGDRLVPILGNGGSVVLTVSKTHALSKAPADIAHVTSVAEILSCLSGLEVQLSIPDVSRTPPLSGVRLNGSCYPHARIHVVLGASPTGETITYEGARACGVPFYDDGRLVSFPGATRGRGRRVYDQEDCCIGQIVGDSIFLFAPAHVEEIAKVFTTRGELFKKMLACAWNAQLETPKKDLPELPITDKKQFKAVLQIVDDTVPGLFARRLAKVDARLHELQQTYAGLVAERHRLRVMQVRLQAEPHYGAQKERVKAWDVLRRIPEYESFTWREDALQIRTRPIVAEHEGKRYLLGTYGARIETEGRVSLWCETSFHPKGHAHPHISKEHVVCFGNIDFELREAAAEGRFADAGLLLVEWFRRGYEPHLADFKIEEWPLVGEEKHGRT